MKNVAIINRADFGSTGKLAFGLLSYLKKNGYNPLLVYCSGGSHKNESVYRMTSTLGRSVHALLARLTGFEGNFSHLETMRLIRKLRKRHTDTIFAFNLHEYYINEKMFFEYIKKDSVRLVYAMIDEYPFRGKCCIDSPCEKYMTGCGNCPMVHSYPQSWFFDRSADIYKMKLINYSGLTNAVFVAPEFVINKARVAPLTKNIKLGILDEAINTDYYKPSDYSTLANKLGVDCSKKIIVTMAPMSADYKGGKYFIELAKRFAGNEEYIFIHVGNSETKSPDYPSNYIAMGYIAENYTVVQLMSMSDLFVFPSLSDTQSNTCLEALSCGTPLLLFDISGMPYIVNESVGKLVEPKNVDQMEAVVRRVEKKTKQQSDTCRNYAISRFSYKDYARKLVAFAEQE